MARLVGARLVAEAVAALMFAAVFAVFCVKIIARYAFHSEMAWADEVSTLLFIWIIFWANSFILAESDHIRFDLLTHLAPRFMALARALLVGGLFLAAAPASLDYLAFLWRERTPVLGLRLDLAYSCFGIFVVSIPIRYGWRAWRER